jgi:hypothetical protein
MESLGFMILSLLKGRLPWDGLRGKCDKETNQMMLDRKFATSLDELCKGVPDQFRKYMEYVRALSFDEKPDYSKLRRMFRALFVRRGFKYDYVFDWTVILYKQSLEPQPALEDASTERGGTR